MRGRGIENHGLQIDLGQCVGRNEVEVVAWVLIGKVQVGNVDYRHRAGERGGGGGHEPQRSRKPLARVAMTAWKFLVG